MAHRESDKFIVLNSLPEEEADSMAGTPKSTKKTSDADRTSVLGKDHIFKNAEEGMPILIEPNFKNVVGLKDDYPNSFLRKEQVKLLLDFFLGVLDHGKKNRLLIVTGP